jgi:hypothetical protein
MWASSKVALNIFIQISLISKAKSYTNTTTSVVKNTKIIFWFSLVICYYYFSLPPEVGFASSFFGSLSSGVVFRRNSLVARSCKVPPHFNPRACSSALSFSKPSAYKATTKVMSLAIEVNHWEADKFRTKDSRIKTKIQQTGLAWQSNQGTNIGIHNIRSQTGSVVVLLHIERMKDVDWQ